MVSCLDFGSDNCSCTFYMIAPAADIAAFVRAIDEICAE